MGMAAKTKLNAQNLEALGAERLATLLLELSEGNAAAKRRLRVELAASAGPDEAAREVRKRLTTIGRSRGMVDWPKVPALATDLEMQRQAIVGTIGKAAPADALELMWRFIALSNGVLERCDDSNGRLVDIFRQGCHDLAALAEAARPDVPALADQVFDSLCANDYGQYDELLAALAPALGHEGLERVKQSLIAYGEATEPATPASEERVVIGWSQNGPLYADQLHERERTLIVRMGLNDIADLQDDVDAYIALHDETVRKAPMVAAAIAARLMGAARPQEALQFLDGARSKGNNMPREWTDVRLAALDALGRSDEAQAQRWASFEATFSAADLRAYLKRLPDFEDEDAERRALALVEASPNLPAALMFLVEWPKLDLAARLIVDRAAELNGHQYEVLRPAADALGETHPLAATLALRAMIDFAVENSRSGRYRHAARDLATCQALSAHIGEWSGIKPHADYAHDLRERHGRKWAFWNHVD